VRHGRSASRLSPRPFSGPAPGPGCFERQPQLPPSSRFDCAHVPLSATTDVELRGPVPLDSADVRGGGARLDSTRAQNSTQDRR
jgi:hypothetical protein